MVVWCCGRSRWLKWAIQSHIATRRRIIIASNLVPRRLSRIPGNRPSASRDTWTAVVQPHRDTDTIRSIRLRPIRDIRVSTHRREPTLDTSMRVRRRTIPMDPEATTPPTVSHGPFPIHPIQDSSRPARDLTRRRMKASSPTTNRPRTCPEAVNRRSNNLRGAIRTLAAAISTKWRLVGISRSFGSCM